MFELQYPYVLFLIIIFIIIFLFFKPKDDALLIPSLKSNTIIKKDYIYILKYLGIVFLLFALSSPIIKKEFTPDKQPSHAIMLSLDVSGSMKANMGNMSKLEVEKKLASEFVLKRKNDNVGLVFFGSFAYVASPLSFDVNAISQIIKNIYQGIAGEYTALNDGLFLSVRMLKKVKAKEKIIILLTDGIEKGSKTNINTLTKAIKGENIKIYTIGLGNKNEYDANYLYQLANISGGKFYEAYDEKALEKIYDNINKLEKSKLQKQSIFQINYYYQYPLFLSFVFFVLFLYFRLKGARS